MTKEERRRPEILNGSRRLRIAKGSGTTVQDVNQLLKQYLQTKKMLRQFKRGGMRGLAEGFFPDPFLMSGGIVCHRRGG